MLPPILSIVIPTYNRRECLKRTLEGILAQRGDGVEVLVSDNCSTDGTWDYLRGLEGSVQSVRQTRNVGAELNMLGLFERATGKYVWLLCDDDLPCPNSVDSIMEAVQEFDSPPFVFLRAAGATDEMCARQCAPAVPTSWREYDRDQFLSEIGEMFTFAPCNIVRRDMIDMAFLREQVGSSLVPAALCLSTAGRCNRIILSDRPLLFGVMGRPCYGTYPVFTRGILALMHRCRSFGFDRRVMRTAYDLNLARVVAAVIRDLTPDWKSFCLILRYGLLYPSFYTSVIPALLRKMVPQRHRSRLKWLARTARNFCRPAMSGEPKTGPK